MSFCCGASMLGTTGSLKQAGAMIHRVPLLLCPVCFRVEVHYLVAEEYEIMAAFAMDDGSVELDFEEFVSSDRINGLYENCVNTENENPMTVVNNQINMALDLVAVAHQLNDQDWLHQLHVRLQALSKRKEKLIQKRAKQ